MESELSTSIESWVKELPSSRMIYPVSFFNRMKYLLWRVYTPYHPYFRDTFVSLGIVSHAGRQKFLMGKIIEGMSIEEFVKFLVGKGFGNHFVAWKDDGEVVSLRYVDNFEYQFHIRVFEDREVRAHYEYTPECHPILHLKEIGVEPRRSDFLKILEDKVALE